MKEQLEVKLVEDFVFMSNNKSAMNCECGDGWFNLLYQLCTEINNVYKDLNIPIDIVIDQIKEKFGTLRFYYSFENHPIGIHALDISDFSLRKLPGVTDKEQRIYNIIQQGEKKSAETCEECGELGSIRTEQPWIQTLCDKCNKIKNEG